MSKINTKHIADEAITNAKLADMTQNTIKGRKTASTGVPEDISLADAKTMLGIIKITVGTTEPSTPATGDLWVDTN